MSMNATRLRLLLIVLISSLMFVQMIDLHWHQHVGGITRHADGAAVQSLHLANAATPHAQHHDSDIRLAGDHGVAHKLPAAIAMPVLLTLLPLLLILLTVVMRLTSPEVLGAPRRPAQFPPPGRGPPQLQN